MINYSYNSKGYALLWDPHWISYRIDIETAIQFALSKIPGQVMKIELDYEDGLLVYEIDILTPHGIYKVEIDANTGRIIKVESD